MKGVILASHGKLAEGLLDTLKMFNGEQEQIETLCLLSGDDIAEFVTLIRETIDKINTGDGVIVFCDLLFGSPCNCSSRLLMAEELKDKIDVITGMNLPMVMEYLACRENGMVTEDIINAGKEGIQDFVKVYKASHDNREGARL